MSSRSHWIILTALAVHATQAQGPRIVAVAAASPFDSAQYRAAWDVWRNSRAKAVLQPGRPLSYTGLTWLHPGSNTVGSASTNDVRLPGRGVPSRLGVLTREGSTVRFEPAAGALVTIDSQRTTGPSMLRTDADKAASQVRAGSAGFRIVKRVDSLGVRAWDVERAALRTFKGIKYFSLDPRWRYDGRFVPLAQPRRVAVMTESGVPEEHEIVGSVETTIGGVPYALTAFRGSRASLFITFADGSSGEESYGFRFLSAPYDRVTNAVVLDFNYAYNPDCAFSPFTTCPLPPPANRVKARLLAGERRLEHERGAR